MFKFIVFVIISCISSYAVHELPKFYSIEKNNMIEINEKVKVEMPIMHLDIPKLDISKDIYDKNSKLNDIDKNVIIMNDSDYPGEKKGMVIIGGHSGYGPLAFFTNLKNLKINDKVYITYKNIKYTYKVVNIYLDSKDGSISINNINEKNKLFLYTCNPQDKANYLVIDCEQI